ncbi:hypothetical protein L7F22_033462 [Adiantum nelumboides]|nr:hypothetical protein [Adiantum nelumboides]
MDESLPPAAQTPAQETSSGWGGGWGNWGNSAFSVISGIQKVAVSAADEITKNAIAAAKDAAKGVAELQENVASSLKLQDEGSAEDASTVTEKAEDDNELPQHNLRSAALQNLEEAGQDTALGHSEEANSTVLDLLKCYVSEHKATWEHYLPLVEYAYNNTVHTSTGKVPFEIVEGGKNVPSILHTKDKIFEADKYVQNTDEAYKKIKLALEKTQSKQRKAANRHRRELVFSLGDWGLKVMDTSVENLASGAWQAFGTAWRGSRSFIQKLENSAESLAESIQKQGNLTYKAGTFAPSLIEGGKAITARGLEVLEYVGKEAIDLIATEAGIQLEDHPKPVDGDMIENDEQFADDVTFDRCFYIYGGPEQLEELEALANHHMLLCNRAKAKLPSEQKSSYDSALKQVKQVLDLGFTGIENAELDKGKRVETGLIGDVNELKQIRETGVAKAAEMAAGFTAVLGGLAVAEVVQKTTDRLEAIRVEGVHRLSELCAAGILQLLNLGKSVLSTSSEQEESVDTIVWPIDYLEKAKLIRAQAQSMSGDIEAISHSFITGIGDVTAAFQAAIRSEVEKEGEKDDAKHELIRERSIEDKAQALSNDLESDGSAAIEKVQSGLRHLVHLVLFTTLKS